LFVNAAESAGYIAGGAGAELTGKEHIEAKSGANFFQPPSVCLPDFCRIGIPFIGPNVLRAIEGGKLMTS